MLERVQELRPGESSIGHRLDHAKALHSYATGMVHYIAKRYPEASFWFRKTLSLLPEHGEAARYLAYAEKFSRQQAVEESTNRPSDVTIVADRFNAIAFEDLPTPPQPPVVEPPTAKPDRMAAVVEPANSAAPSAQPTPATPAPPANATPSNAARSPINGVAEAQTQRADAPPAAIAPTPPRIAPTVRTTPLPPIGAVGRPTAPTAPTAPAASRNRPTAPPGAPTPTSPSSPTRPSSWK
jgi:hypothetical protein